jgi:hypothetical protein
MARSCRPESPCAAAALHAKTAALHAVEPAFKAGSRRLWGKVSRSWRSKVRPTTSRPTKAQTGRSRWLVGHRHLGLKTRPGGEAEVACGSGGWCEGWIGRRNINELHALSNATGVHRSVDQTVTFGDGRADGAREAPGPHQFQMGRLIRLKFDEFFECLFGDVALVVVHGRLGQGLERLR